MSQVVLLGPLHDELDAGRVLRDIGVRERVALITAGWQERESEDEALVAKLGVPVVNLCLHARAEEVFAKDAPLLTAYKARQERLRHLQDFYRVRLDHADDAAMAIAVRHVDRELLAEEARISVEVLRQLDRFHLERCRAVQADFEERFRPEKRETVARQREEVRALLESAAALVIAGGHVATLLNRMRLFDVVRHAAPKPVVAWSAGAMVLTDRIVLFHDHPPYGKDIAQLLDVGFGLAPGLVVLPDPRRRIRMDDKNGIARFAQRMAPAACVAMDHGAYVVLEDGKVVRASAERLLPSGDTVRGWAG